MGRAIANARYPSPVQPFILAFEHLAPSEQGEVHWAAVRSHTSESRKHLLIG